MKLHSKKHLNSRRIRAYIQDTTALEEDIATLENNHSYNETMADELAEKTEKECQT